MTVKRIFAALLTAALVFAFAACRRTDPKPEPTAAPTAGPTAEVTVRPTEDGAPTAPAQPADAPDHSFNAETLEYEDEYVRFTLPAGQSLLHDSTAEWGDGYLRYIFFSDPDNAEVSTSYCVQPAEGELYADFTQADFEQLFKLFYERSLESEVTVETLLYEKLNDGSASGVIYEYSVKYDGAEIRQLLYSVVTAGDLSITVAYTFDDEAAALASAQSIEVK